MKVQGQRTLNAPREAVWQAVLDPEVLTHVLPGCEEFREVGDNEFEGLLKIKIGPVQGKFKGQVSLSNLQEPESYDLHVKGKGAPGFVDGKGTLRLEDHGPTTELIYEVDAKVGGRIASVGQRLLDSSTKVITQKALDGLEQQIEARYGSSEDNDEAAAAPTPISQNELAAEVAKGVAEDLFPLEKQVWALPILGMLFLLPPLLIFIFNC
jgi:carbon monoxide dehydrogenase subunit G